MTIYRKTAKVLTIFNFQQSQVAQNEFDKLANLLLKDPAVNATSKFDFGKVISPLHLPLKFDAVFKQQRASKVPYLDDVFMQSQTKEEMFLVLEQYHQILQNENMKAAPDKSHFFLTRVKFLGHIIYRNTITPVKTRIDVIQKLQPPTNKKKIEELLEMLNILSKYVYKKQLCLRAFYNIL